MSQLSLTEYVGDSEPWPEANAARDNDDPVTEWHNPPSSEERFPPPDFCDYPQCETFLELITSLEGHSQNVPRSAKEFNNEFIEAEAYLWLGNDCYRMVTFEHYALFRYAVAEAGHAPQHMFFFLPPLKLGEGVEAITPSRFAEQIRARKYGRYLIYQWPKAEAWWLGLFLRPDGTGFFAESGDHVEFTWQPEMAGLPSFAAAIDAPTERLIPLCEQVLIEQIMPRMALPFLPPDVAPPALPITFQCGSEAGLRRVTRWVLHHEPDTFWEQPTVCVQYWAMGTEYNQGRFVVDKRLSNQGWHLLQLALAHNLFTGFDCSPDSFSKYYRRWNYVQRAEEMTMEVCAPSAHERIEALLELGDWLDGKIPESEKLALLNSEPDFSVRAIMLKDYEAYQEGPEYDEWDYSLWSDSLTPQDW